MKKIIKKWGEGLSIYLDKEDQKIYGFKEGDVVDITITYIRTKRKGGLKNETKNKQAFA